MVSLTIEEGRTWFKPGETIAGDASWRLDEEADTFEVRLFWYTTGKGSRDVGVVRTRRIEQPERDGSRKFRLDVPRGPYSFSGKLITLAWAIEIVALPSGETERLDIVIAPTPVEVDLT